jgi:anti-sigma regulatory factor (Ser/Thr protein kinase)
MARSTLRLPEARQEDLADIRAFVADAARWLGADEEAIEDLVQAVDESATNVIRHGYRGLPGRLDIGMDREGDALVVTLRDEAPPFDPTGWPEPDPERSLAGRAQGGFGIHLTRSCVDLVSHRELDPPGNVLTLVRRLTTPTQEGPS